MGWFALSFLSLLLWLYLLGFRDGFWRSDQRLVASPEPAYWPTITAIIPARDEADTIITAHMASDYPGALAIILVDDHSSDATASIASNSATNKDRSLTITQAPPLPSGWTGKLWALQAGLEAAAVQTPDAEFYLLTDADIVHDPKTLRLLVAKSVNENLALTSLMAHLDSRGFWGALLAPAFIYFFQKLYPFPATNNPWRMSAAAAGGCMLVRRNALEESGGISAIRENLIDDCALARQIKGNCERRIWLGLSDNEVISMRDNRSLSSFWHMVARTAYTQLDYSIVKLIGSIISMGIIYLSPLATILTYPYHENTLAIFIAMVTWLIMILSYIPTLSLYRKQKVSALFLPIAAFFYILMTLSSAYRHFRGRGGQWKGRRY